MIKFFQKIRRRLLKENKFNRYFIYAIGEIILVVIGILIALQVNNWNENKLQHKKTEVIFNQIINELVVDVKIIQDVQKFYLNKDSIIEVYSQTDFKNLKSQNENKIDNFVLAEMIRTYAPFTINDRGFNLLINQTDQLNNKYKDHIEELFFLYQNVRVDIDYFNENLEKLLEEHRMYKIKNYDWYSQDLKTKRKKTEEFDYYKYNPTYRNFVVFYNQTIRNVIIPSRLFEDNAIKFCRKINSEFNLNRDIDKEFSITNPTSKILKSVVGSYVNKRNDTLFFEESGNQLYESTYDEKNFQYNSQRRFIDGNLRYLNDSLFYRNRVENIKLNADGSLSLINIFNDKPISLRRVSK